MLNKHFTHIIIAAAVLSLAQIAGATLGTINIEHDGYGAVGTAQVWGGGLSGSSVKAGVYMLDKSAGTGDGNLWDNGLIGAFCIDLSQNAPGYDTTYQVVMPQDAPTPTTFLGETMGAAKAAYLSELFGRHYDPAWVEGGSWTSAQNAAAEAFAAAVWEIIYEDLPASPALWNVTADGTSGSLGFKATGLDTTLANSFLHSLDGTGPMAELRAFRNSCKQDFIAVVPEPATILMLGLGSLSLLRRRTA